VNYTLHFGAVWASFDHLLGGLAIGLGLAVAAVAIGTLIGLLSAFASVSHSRLLRAISGTYVLLIRNIPLLVQIFLWYHVVPKLFPVMAGLPPFILVVFALGFFTSARIAEQLRSGIQALPKGQRYAGMAMGFTTPQYYRYVILPMAYRIIIPPLTSESMNIFKNSSVAFAVSIPEMIQFAMQAGEETSRVSEMYLAVTVLYVISAMIINRIMAGVEKRVRVPGFVVAGTGGGH